MRSYAQSASYTCDCVHPDSPGIGDFDVSTHCIETELVSIGSGCYSLYVYQHQHQPSLDRPTVIGCDQGGRGPQSYLTFEFSDLDCWNDNDITLQVIPWTQNTTYNPQQTNWLWDSSGTQFDGYQIAPATTGATHLSKFTFQRRNNSDGSSNPLLDCRVDTFRICLDCTDSIEENCIDKLDLEVYFSDANGSPNCTNEIPIIGRDRDTLALRPARCSDSTTTANCTGDCDLYESSCNSVAVEWGCDYADVSIINDHAYPQCGELGEFTIDFTSDGMSLCEDDPMYADGSGNSMSIPGFRDWKSIYDPTNRRLTFRAPPGCGLQSCDTFKFRIPFCCETDNKVGLKFGGDVCEIYSYPGSDTLMRPVRHAFDDPPACADCYMDEDKGMIAEAMTCVLDSNSDGICDVWAEDLSGCDTLKLFNRNHNPTSGNGTGCGDDDEGNLCWDRIDLQLDPNLSSSCLSISVPRSPGATIAENPIGSGNWVITLGITVCACDSLSILLCCYNGPIVWTTVNNSNPIHTDSVRGDWDALCTTYNGGGQNPSKISITDFDHSRSRDGSISLLQPIPNPANRSVVVVVKAEEYVEDLDVQVFRSNGELQKSWREHAHRSGQVATEIDVSTWPTGRYYVRVTTRDGRNVNTSFSVVR